MADDSLRQEGPKEAEEPRENLARCNKIVKYRGNFEHICQQQEIASTGIPAAGNDATTQSDPLRRWSS